MTAELYVAILVSLLFATFIFSIVINRRHAKSKLGEAYDYLAQQANIYWREKNLTEVTSQKIFQNLFDINPKVLQSAEFWKQPYVRMLELIIASCKESKLGLDFIYGTIDEKTQGHIGRQPRKQVWIEFVFEDTPYIIKIDDKCPDKLRITGRRYMYERGYVKQACLHDGKVVRETYERIMQRDNP